MARKNRKRERNAQCGKMIHLRRVIRDVVNHDGDFGDARFDIRNRRRDGRRHRKWLRRLSTANLCEAEPDQPQKRDERKKREKDFESAAHESFILLKISRVCKICMARSKASSTTGASFLSLSLASAGAVGLGFPKISSS